MGGARLRCAHFPSYHNNIGSERTGVKTVELCHVAESILWLQRYAAP
jgi:hypothetical protein